MKRWLWIFLILPTGCALIEFTLSEPTENERIAEKLWSLQALYGPPEDKGDIAEFVSSIVRYDVDGDGQRDILVFFTDEGLGDLGIRSINLLKIKSVPTRGFALMIRMDEQLWPIFYYFSDYRIPLRYGTVQETEGIIYESGKGGMQTVWGWTKSLEYPARWEALYRIWDHKTDAYGPFHEHEKMTAVFKK